MRDEVGSASLPPLLVGATTGAGLLRKTLKNILAEYGATAMVVYLTIFTIVLLSFWTAIHFGWKLDGAAQNVGAFTAAYLATKVTQPLRIAATLALTPLVVRVLERMRPRAAAVIVPVEVDPSAPVPAPGNPTIEPGSTSSS